MNFNYLSHFSKRERMFLLLSLGVIGIAILMKYIVQPYKEYMEQLQSQIDSKEIRFVKYKRLVLFKEKSVQLIEKLSKIDSTGNVEGEMSRFLKEIESLSRKSGVRILDVRPLPVELKDFYRRFSVELRAESTMGPLANFLYRLQTSPLYLTVQKLGLTTYEENSGESKLKSHFTIIRVLIDSDSEPRMTAIKH